MSLLRGRCHVWQEEGCGEGLVPQESHLLVSDTKDAGPLRTPTLSAETWMAQALGSSSRTNQTLKLHLGAVSETSGLGSGDSGS